MNLSESTNQRKSAERLAEIITALQGRFILTLSEELENRSISFPQYCVLDFLSRSGALTMSDIASKMGSTTAAATGMVDRLEKNGYVSRIGHRGDRRQCFVEITEAGVVLVGKIHAEILENILEIMIILEPSEAKTWLQISQKIFAYCGSSGKGAVCAS